MATILAHITVREGAEQPFEAIARKMHRGTHDNETAMRAYGYWRGADPRTYYALLSFDDFPSFIVHQSSPHHEEASPAFGGVIESMRLEWVDPVAGASVLSPTNAPDAGWPGPDADELTQRYAKRYAAQIAEWWGPLR